MIIYILHIRTVGLLYVSACRYRRFELFACEVLSSRGAYDAFYQIMLRVVNIASEEFAAYVQELVVRPSHPRSLGSALTPPRFRSALSQRDSLSRALALQHSCSAALAQRVSLSRALALSRSRSAALLLGRALAASLTRWVRVRPALLLGRAPDG